MWAVFFIAVVLAMLLLKCRETFVVKYGNPFDGEDLISLDTESKGTRLFAFGFTTPDRCPATHPEYDGGLCYVECDPGYNGVGPVCWADTTDRGMGRFARFKTCEEMKLVGYRDDPLTCWKDLTCNWSCASSKRDLFGNCFAWDLRADCSGPDLKIKSLECPGPAWAYLGVELTNPPSKRADYTALTEGFCYRQCPKERPNTIPGMPYLCTEGARGLSYGRGVGIVPPIFVFGA